MTRPAKTYEDGLRDGLAVCMQYAQVEYTDYSETTDGDYEIDWDDAKAAIEKLAKIASEKFKGEP